MAARPTVPGTAQQHAVEWLRWSIVSGCLKPGQRINQEIVAEEAGLSLAPVREALRVLEGEGQVTYRPRRGYFVTELRLGDLREIYAMRQLLEERAARLALPNLDDDALERVVQAARDCADAVEEGDVAAELDANRRFHLSILEACGQSQLMRVIRVLWDSTEAYRAMYYNAPEERSASVRAHDMMVEALRARDVDRLVVELDRHRDRALEVLGRILVPVDASGVISA
jgi:DNA-binding GntR family transcriptional regulator